MSAAGRTSLALWSVDAAAQALARDDVNAAVAATDRAEDISKLVRRYGEILGRRFVKAAVLGGQPPTNDRTLGAQVVSGLLRSTPAPAAAIRKSARA
jgi:hypothetical protein